MITFILAMIRMAVLVATLLVALSLRLVRLAVDLAVIAWTLAREAAITVLWRLRRRRRRTA